MTAMTSSGSFEICFLVHSDAARPGYFGVDSVVERKRRGSVTAAGAGALERPDVQALPIGVMGGFLM